MRQVRFKRVEGPAGVEIIDFSSNTLAQVREGNTLSLGRWVRRGLPKLLPVEELKIPFSRNIELLSYTKTNGYCCMLSYTEEGSLFIATRNLSMVSGGSKVDNERFATHREVLKLWQRQTSHLSDKQMVALSNQMTGQTWICEYLNPAGSQLIRYSSEP